MKVFVYKIAGGNPTALVPNDDRARQTEIAKKLLKKVEQVGFVDISKKTLEMMGGELCINATLAAAKLFGGAGTLSINGQKVAYSETERNITVSIALRFNTDIPNTVLMDDIGYIFVKKQLSLKALAALSKKYRLPAFGSVKMKANVIQPRVYVREVNSCIDETACGSGSIAAAILFRRRKIIQPSGGTIFIDKTNQTFTIRAEVNEMEMKK